MLGCSHFWGAPQPAPVQWLHLQVRPQASPPQAAIHHTHTCLLLPFVPAHQLCKSCSLLNFCLQALPGTGCGPLCEAALVPRLHQLSAWSVGSTLTGRVCKAVVLCCMLNCRPSQSPATLGLSKQLTGESDGAQAEPRTCSVTFLSHQDGHRLWQWPKHVISVSMCI